MTQTDALALQKDDVIENGSGLRMTITMTMPARPELGYDPSVMGWKNGDRRSGHSVCFVLDGSEQTARELAHWTKVA
jgi:hypothetical protein